MSQPNRTACGRVNMISEPWVHYYIGDKLLDLIIEEFEGKEIYMTIEVID